MTKIGPPGRIHHLRRLSIEIVLPDLEQALALRPRLEALGRTLMPLVLERVLDALAPADRHVFIERLSLDLGTLSAGQLEADALTAFERALTDALVEALARAGTASNGPERTLSPEEARLALAEAFLVNGVFPFWAGAEAPAPGVLLRTLAAEQPDAMAALLRRRGHDRVVLERLVLQAGEEGLRRLLAALAPADAATIAAWLADIVRLHRQEPLLPQPAEAVERLLWRLTFDYLVREAGSQFNRRSYLRSLLRGVAESEGFDYAAFLLLLHRGMQRIGRQRPLGSSLPAVLRDLLEEEPAETDTVLLDGAVSGDEEALLALLRRHARNRSTLEALVRELSPELFARMVCRLEPTHAALILAFLDDLARRHREEALLPLSEQGVGQLTRQLTLILLLRDPGTQFNRRSWLRALLEEMSARENVSYEALLSTLARSLARTGGRGPAGFSLPGLVAELAGEPGTLSRAKRFLRGGGSPADGDTLPLLLDRDRPGLAALLRRLAADRAAWNSGLDRLLGRLAPEEVVALLAPDQAVEMARRARQETEPGTGLRTAWERMLTALMRDEPPGVARPLPAPGRRLDRLARLRHWLDRGETPWWAPDPVALERSIRSLPDLPLAELLGLFQSPDPARTADRLRRAVETLGREHGHCLLLRLAPEVLAASPKNRDSLEAQLVTIADQLAGRSPDAPLAATSAGSVIPSAADRVALLAWLEGNGADDQPWGDRFHRLLAGLLDDDDGLDAVLSAGLGQERGRSRWVARLPDEILGRILHRVEPALAGLLEDAIVLLSAAWRQTASPARRGLADGMLWAMLFAELAATPAGHRSPRVLVEGLVRGLTGGDPSATAPFLARARFLAGEAGQVGLLAVLRPVPAKPAPPGGTVREPARWCVRREASGTLEVAEPIHVGNAGLVLLNPFLPLFLERLGVLTPEAEGIPRVTGLAAASRAVHLLQYLADGRCDRSEPALVLNKVLCGLEPAL
ncbi:MAG TPA: contractile injection system tape measure protein, partial [Azospirillaceae bacterium]|nr:contractile injection system tape measure protein [Azospirillaceae bacterium]